MSNAELAEAFADAGIDVIAEQVDSPITIAQVAEKRGILMIGKDLDIQGSSKLSERAIRNFWHHYKEDMGL